MKLTIELSGGRGVLDAEGDDVRVESGALIVLRDGDPVLVIAGRVWNLAYPADVSPFPAPRPPGDIRDAFPTPTRDQICAQATDIPDPVRHLRR